MRGKQTPSLNAERTMFKLSTFDASAMPPLLYNTTLPPATWPGAGESRARNNLFLEISSTKQASWNATNAACCSGLSLRNSSFTAAQYRCVCAHNFLQRSHSQLPTLLINFGDIQPSILSEGETTSCITTASDAIGKSIRKREHPVEQASEGRSREQQYR